MVRVENFRVLCVSNLPLLCESGLPAEDHTLSSLTTTPTYIYIFPPLVLHSPAAVDVDDRVCVFVMCVCFWVCAVCWLCVCVCVSVCVYMYLCVCVCDLLFDPLVEYQERLAESLDHYKWKLAKTRMGSCRLLHGTEKQVKI